MNVRSFSIMKFMKCLVLAIFCVFEFVGAVSAASRRPTPVPFLYINDTPLVPPVQPPVVDAFMFINQSTFITSNDFLFLPLAPLPWEAQSVQIWTNLGTMIGFPGYRFNYKPNPVHLTSAQRRKRGALLPKPALIFDNSGDISVTDFLEINARRLLNSGTLSGDLNARMRFFGGSEIMDLSGSAIRVGDLDQPACITGSNFFFGPFFFFGDPAVNYTYFSSGINGSLTPGVGPPLELPTLTGGGLGVLFTPPNPITPPFEFRQTFSIFPGLPATNTVTNLQGAVLSCGQFEAFVHVDTNANLFFDRQIDVVFVPTNGLSENVSVEVRFPTVRSNFVFFSTDSPIVEFRAVYDDVITQRPATNYLTFRDDGLNVFRGHDCEFDIARPPNLPFTPDIYYSTNHATNFADYTYTVALVNVGNTNSIYFTNSPGDDFFFFPNLGQSLAASDPTNRPGSIEIVANRLDLTQARLRAENGIFIRATNLIGNESGILDAPFISFDAATTNQNLVLSNFTRPQVSRLQAQLNSWAGSWTVPVTNGAAVETWSYRVLILGACVNTLTPTITHRFTLQATNIVIEDDLAINAALLLRGRSLTIGSNGSITMPQGASIAFTNVIGMLNFTNYGVVNSTRGAFFGLFEDGYIQPRAPRRRTRRPQPPRLAAYDNIVNHGTINASSTKLRARYVEHSGLPFPFAPATILGTNGPVTLDGATLVVSNATVSARADIRLVAGDMLVTQSSLQAGAVTGGLFGGYLPGAILIDVTNSITDGGTDANNEWRVTAGVRMGRQPAALGDLMGTHIVSLASTFVQALHTWAAEDRGPTVEGFSNNLAVGRLTLDGALGNQFRFRSGGAGNAIYIDYLELLNSATNFNFALGVDPGFTIYFADSNVDPEKLDSQNNGRIRWVPDFIGPQSSTNLLYPDGIHTFNAGVVRSSQRDDDGDRIANVSDCTPIPVPGVDTFGQNCPPGFSPLRSLAIGGAVLNLQIALTADRSAVILSWDAAAHTGNRVEFTESLSDGQWQVLTNFINGPANGRVSVSDSAKASARVYRIRVDAEKR